MTIRRQKLHALILSRAKVGEADRRLLLFTRDHGVLPVVARGVRKIPSRRGGYVEPLTHIVALVSGTPSRYFLAAVEAVNEYLPLRADADALAQAHYLAELVRQVLPEAEAQESLFDALSQAFDLLPDLAPVKRNLLEAAITLHALESAGWLPQLGHCGQCGTNQPTDAVVLNAQLGGWRCLPCHHSLADTRYSLAPLLLKVVRFVARYPERALKLNVSFIESEQVVATLRHYTAGVVGQPLLSPVATFNPFYAR